MALGGAKALDQRDDGEFRRACELFFLHSNKYDVPFSALLFRSAFSALRLVLEPALRLRKDQMSRGNDRIVSLAEVLAAFAAKMTLLVEPD